MMPINSGLFTSDSPEWETPATLFNELNKEFNFDLDVAATDSNAKCIKYYTRETDALSLPWEGACFMNPPYGRQIKFWIKKAYESSLSGATVVCLVPARTDTAWWHDYCTKG